MDEKRIITEVEKALSSLDKIEKEKAPDFFYTRLEGRLQQPAGLGVAAIRWSAALLVLLLVMNTFFWIRVEEASDTSDDIEVMALEYEVSDEYILEMLSYEE